MNVLKKPVIDAAVEQLLKELSDCSETEAIAVGGSRATGRVDQKSDYDIYVYTEGKIADEIRRKILGKYCCVMEIGNHYWETEDNCTLNNGVDIDIIYRNLEEFGNEVAGVTEQFHVSGGYTTCMWHNLVTCAVLYDRAGRLESMKERFTIPYPAGLKAAIIKKNRALLSGVLPSYDAQIRKAAGRGDYVSVNHRTTEFLASYFDILFALNEKTHPGEKRLVQICREQCEVLPERFEENLDRLFSCLYGSEVNSVVADIIKELDRALNSYGRL